MKTKVFFLVIILALCVGAQAQTSNSKETKKATKVKKQAEARIVLIKSIENQDFTFTALSMSDQKWSSSQNNYLIVDPHKIEVFLPYTTKTSVPGAPTYLKFEKSKYEYSVDTITDERIFVSIIVENAVNQAAFNGGLSANMTYKIKLEITLKNSNAILTLLPEFYTEVRYNGQIRKIR